MKNEHYEKPAVKVVFIQQRQHLLSGSGGMKGEISGYEKSSGGFEQDE